MLCVCTFQSRQISTNFIRSATVPYTMIIDTHCHLASAQFDQSRRETYVQHALREGIDRMITLGRGWMTGRQTRRGRASFPARFFVRWASIRTMPMTPRQTGRTSFSGRRRTFPWPPSGKRAWITSTGRPKAGKRNNSTAFSRTFWNGTLTWRSAWALISSCIRGTGKVPRALRTPWLLPNYAGRVRPVFHCFIGNTAQGHADL